MAIFGGWVGVLSPVSESRRGGTRGQVCWMRNERLEMNRREFLTTSSAAALATASSYAATGIGKRPRAITMWEFSWIERRWPGAGFEDWDAVLDGLQLRGYDAVRIDPFPH